MQCTVCPCKMSAATSPACVQDTDRAVAQQHPAAEATGPPCCMHAASICCTPQAHHRVRDESSMCLWRVRARSINKPKSKYVLLAVPPVAPASTAQHSSRPLRHCLCTQPRTDNSAGARLLHRPPGVTDGQRHRHGRPAWPSSFRTRAAACAAIYLASQSQSAVMNPLLHNQIEYANSVAECTRRRTNRIKLCATSCRKARPQD